MKKTCANKEGVLNNPSLRYVNKREINFKQVVDVKLPKAKKIKKTRSESWLYDIEVIEDDPRIPGLRG